MEIKVGGKYNQRGGGVVEIERVFATDMFIGSNGYGYYVSGVTQLSGRMDRKMHDLISEYTETKQEYGPWIILNDGELMNVATTEFARNGDGLPIAYRVAIEPITRTAIGHVHMYGIDAMTVYHSKASETDTECKQFEITVKGDDISIRWTE